MTKPVSKSVYSKQDKRLVFDRFTRQRVNASDSVVIETNHGTKGKKREVDLRGWKTRSLNGWMPRGCVDGWQAVVWMENKKLYHLWYHTVVVFPRHQSWVLNYPKVPFSIL